MPNNQRPDYVAPHQHNAGDVNGLGILTPPIQVAVPTTSAPTSTTSTYALLPEMTLPITPPDHFPLWQATLRFNGQFSHGQDPGLVGVKLQQDGVDVANTTRVTASIASNAVTFGTQATVVIPAGTEVTFEVFWANVTNAGTATATSTRRSFEVELQPYNPAVL